MGVPRVTPYPYRFVQNYTIKPTHMYILHEGTIHTFRQIFMDGRTHPPELEPSWFGHSIGTWDKDTLVIDTVGYNDKFWFDRRGTPHTEQLHTIERWTRLTKGTARHRRTKEMPRCALEGAVTLGDTNALAFLPKRNTVQRVSVTMVKAITIHDPGAYSRPFTVTFNAQLAPAGDELMENFCQENNQFGVASGLTHPSARPDQERK